MALSAAVLLAGIPAALADPSASPTVPAESATQPRDNAPKPGADFLSCSRAFDELYQAPQPGAATARSDTGAP
jgi:hypothetical protein